jgi:16S rRNA processing protein RimM
VTERFVVGVVGGPFGVKGHVKIKLFSGETRHLEGLASILVRTGTTERSYDIEEIQGSAANFVLKFRGVDSPEAARLLQGAELISDRAGAAPLEAGEYYVEDLRGLAVVCSGETLGELSDIIEGGGGQLAEITLADGNRRLVPFRNEFFGDIDLPGRCIELKVRWILA